MARWSEDLRPAADQLCDPPVGRTEGIEGQLLVTRVNHSLYVVFQRARIVTTIFLSLAIEVATPPRTNSPTKLLLNRL